jgi:microcystin-dependent protein
MKRILPALLLSSLLAAAPLARATSFTYQGQLATDAGTPLKGNQTVEFRLYASETGGTPGWGRAYAVLLDDNGLFNVEITDADGSPLAGVPGGTLDAFLVANASQTVYLGVTAAGSSGEIAPRQPVLPVPYALHAADASSASGDFSASGRLIAGSLAVSGEAAFASAATAEKNASVGGNLAVEGAISGFGTVPAGGIVLWSGAANEIPSGWHLCDGTEGTPDLRDRFVVGAGGEYGKGDRGGEATHTLSVGEMPSHSHAVWARSSGYSGKHNNDHEVITYANKDWGGWSEKVNDTEAAGGGSAHENRPPFYALCYIMRVE